MANDRGSRSCASIFRGLSWKVSGLTSNRQSFSRPLRTCALNSIFTAVDECSPSRSRTKAPRPISHERSDSDANAISD